MAYPTDGLLVWEINDGVNADDTNGGAYYNDGTSGAVDKSQGAAIARTDLVLGSGGTTVTSALVPFVAGDVNNLMNITGGTGFTTGRYRIVSVAAGVATLSSSAGTGGSTGGTSRLGGPMRSPGLCAEAATAIASTYGTVWLTGGHSITSDTSNIAAGRAVFPQGYVIRGYNATRGDNVLSASMIPNLSRSISTNTAMIGFTGGQSNLTTSISNVRFTSTLGRVHSIGNIFQIHRCWFSGGDFTEYQAYISDCALNLSGFTVLIQNSDKASVTYSFIAANTIEISGTHNDNIYLVGTTVSTGDVNRGLFASNCTFISSSTIFPSLTSKIMTFNRCLFYSVASTNSVTGSALFPVHIIMRNCAYNVAPTNVHNTGGILYTGDPFVNRAGFNYALTSAFQTLLGGPVGFPVVTTTLQPSLMGAVVPIISGGGGGSSQIAIGF